MGEQERGLLYGSGGRVTGPVISGPVMGPPVSQLDLPASSLILPLARRRKHFPSMRVAALDRISRRLNIGPAWRPSEFSKATTNQFRASRRTLSCSALLLPSTSSSSSCILAWSNARWISDALIAQCSNTLVCKTLPPKTQMLSFSLARARRMLLHDHLRVREIPPSLIHKSEQQIFSSTSQERPYPTRHNTVRS